MGFFDFLTEEIAIDLGTANTLIIHNDKVVVDAPSIVARDRTTGKIIAVGREAAHTLAERAYAAGWEVSLLQAPEGRDWNDMLTMKGECT